MKNNSHSQPLTTLVAYGTFITNNLWKNYENVEVCLVKNYRRILPPENWFPYVLPDINAQFWGLKFEVNFDQLNQLDKFEGLDMGFFYRKIIKILLMNNSEIMVEIYIPTEKIIELENLSLDLDIEDRWKLEIKKHPDIIKQFPLLIL
ncbi:unnamed protein product [marine sediment metagenome]|uniref:Gamma-glutamylcyclotransferase AIG2-like domain-containing protein n=1 Tax=marine sediment metagenome TaxID=412755 RepID=X1UUX9_9ZZZZ